MKNTNGKFIVIDGTDGSGKTTQLELLASRLKSLGYKVELADFPQYNNKSAGLVEEYLSGKYGSADEVGPYIASVFYAVDRFDASFKIREWLKSGAIVLSNRYVAANMGHQGGKISNPLERKAYFDWLYKLEFEMFNLPQPDLNLILHVPARVAAEMAAARTRIDWSGKTADIHEDNLSHLINAEQTYLEIAEGFPNFKLVSCAQDNLIKSKEEINDLIWSEINQLINPNAEPEYIDIEIINQQGKLPTRGNENDAGLDLYSADYYTLLPGDRAIISTGIKIAIPNGYTGLIWDKSSVSSCGIKVLGGVIDAGYRGEIKIGLINLSREPYLISSSQKIAQILIQKISLPKVRTNKINDNTSRGTNGYGSTGMY
ncbi:MAG: dUTP diphosphatase [bacterium]